MQRVQERARRHLRHPNAAALLVAGSGSWWSDVARAGGLPSAREGGTAPGRCRAFPVTMVRSSATTATCADLTPLFEADATVRVKVRRPAGSGRRWCGGHEGGCGRVGGGPEMRPAWRAACGRWMGQRGGPVSILTAGSRKDTGAARVVTAATTMSPAVL